MRIIWCRIVLQAALVMKEVLHQLVRWVSWLTLNIPSFRFDEPWKPDPHDVAQEGGSSSSFRPPQEVLGIGIGYGLYGHVWCTGQGESRTALIHVHFWHLWESWHRHKPVDSSTFLLTNRTQSVCCWLGPLQAASFQFGTVTHFLRIDKPGLELTSFVVLVGSRDPN